VTSAPYLDFRCGQKGCVREDYETVFFFALETVDLYRCKEKRLLCYLRVTISRAVTHVI
jgi:hypothetical protein